ncbi:CRISPR-associated endonuclease Cas3'' [Thermococcus sp. P6]|uniref:CRISPR-associated endonuclease Cas3'' n=1 Tax=Thermococcus sp. P6 TaxID=122420 RepID=UPI001E3A3FD5|nr:CRISPR-associated endonuclease Cas3'' [Thermococcus sp. P6]
MKEHVTRGLELIDRLYLQRNYGSLIGRIVGVTPEEAETLLRKAYVLHDAGKCLEFFQKRKSKFPFHEFYSGVIAMEVLKKFGEAGRVASVAIMLHHHDWVRSKTPKKPPDLKLEETCRHLLEELSGESIPGEMNWVEPVRFQSNVKGILQKNLRGVYAFLLPITVADNYAAACNRGGKGSLLGREIFETLSVRGWEVARCLSGGIR